MVLCNVFIPAVARDGGTRKHSAERRWPPSTLEAVHAGFLTRPLVIPSQTKPGWFHSFKLSFCQRAQPVWWGNIGATGSTRHSNIGAKMRKRRIYPGIFFSLRCAKSDLRELLPNSLDLSHRSFWYRAPTVTERWTNYGKAAICGLLRVLNRPTKHEEIIVTVKSHKVALF